MACQFWRINPYLWKRWRQHHVQRGPVDYGNKVKWTTWTQSSRIRLWHFQASIRPYIQIIMIFWVWQWMLVLVCYWWQVWCTGRTVSSFRMHQLLTQCWVYQVQQMLHHHSNEGRQLCGEKEDQQNDDHNFPIVKYATCGKFLDWDG